MAHELVTPTIYFTGFGNFVKLHCLACDRECFRACFRSKMQHIFTYSKNSSHSWFHKALGFYFARKQNCGYPSNNEYLLHSYYIYSLLPFLCLSAHKLTFCLKAKSHSAVLFKTLITAIKFKPCSTNKVYNSTEVKTIRTAMTKFPMSGKWQLHHDCHLADS